MEELGFDREAGNFGCILHGLGHDVLIALLKDSVLVLEFHELYAPAQAFDLILLLQGLLQTGGHLNLGHLRFQFLELVIRDSCLFGQLPSEFTDEALVFFRLYQSCFDEKRIGIVG